MEYNVLNLYNRTHELKLGCDVQKMKTIEVDDDIYRYIASQTQQIGENASDILRRLLMTSQPIADEINFATAQNNSANQSIIVEKAIDKDPQKRLQKLLNSDEFINESRAIGRFMLLLSNLYQIDEKAFYDAAALKVKGRKRIYFAQSEEILLASGKTTKPKQIPNTPYWVITNTNTGRKQQMLQQLMEKMSFKNQFIDRVVNTINLVKES